VNGSTPTIAFLPEAGAWGPTNSCVAIAEVLRARGVRCVFVVEASFEGVLAARGFDEVVVQVAPPAEGEGAVGEGWAEYVRQTAPEFRKATIEQLATVIRPIWETLADQGEYVHEQLDQAWGELVPDVIVTDNVSAFPSILTAGVPWVRVVSCNPLEMRDPALPPTFSGYACAGGDDWAAFHAEYRHQCSDVHGRFDAFCRSWGAPPLEPLEFQYESPWLNIHVYPQELDYPRSRALGPTWHRVDSTVRDPDRAFDVAALVHGEGPLAYLSLGSLGSMDVGLMQRLIDTLDRAGIRAVVSLGMLGGELRLGSRMYGEAFLPQTAVVPQCDVVIGHGGNNTFCECLHFGKPTVVLPLFWDQYDNAQRAAEAGIGVRLPSYDWGEDVLVAAVERLLGDGALAARLAPIAARLQAQPGRIRAADLIEQLLRTGRPVERTLTTAG